MPAGRLAKGVVRIREVEPFPPTHLAAMRAAASALKTHAHATLADFSLDDAADRSRPTTTSPNWWPAPTPTTTTAFGRQASRRQCTSTSTDTSKMSSKAISSWISCSPCRHWAT